MDEKQRALLKARLERLDIPVLRIGDDVLAEFKKRRDKP